MVCVIPLFPDGILIFHKVSTLTSPNRGFVQIIGDSSQCLRLITGILRTLRIGTPSRSGGRLMSRNVGIGGNGGALIALTGGACDG